MVRRAGDRRSLPPIRSYSSELEFTRPRERAAERPLQSWKWPFGSVEKAEGTHSSSNWSVGSSSDPGSSTNCVTGPLFV